MANFIWCKNLCCICSLSEHLMYRSKWQLAEANDFNCKEVTWSCPKVKIDLQHISASTLKDGVCWSVCWIQTQTDSSCSLFSSFKCLLRNTNSFSGEHPSGDLSVCLFMHLRRGWRPAFVHTVFSPSLQAICEKGNVGALSDLSTSTQGCLWVCC